MKSFRKKIDHMEGDTPVSAMIDIVFLLLIYFILTQRPIIEETLLDFSPALKGVSSHKVQHDFVTLELGKDNKNSLFNGQMTDNSSLQKMLYAIAQNNNKTKVIIFCADEVKHTRLVEILDICRQSGLKDVNVMAK